MTVVIMIELHGIIDFWINQRNGSVFIMHAWLSKKKILVKKKQHKNPMCMCLCVHVVLVIGLVTMLVVLDH